ncbi:MAG: MATE family efflux transporter [Tenacibaculum sp.]
MVLKQYIKEFSYNWKLSAPVMLGMLGHAFVGFVDSIMVGKLGTAELAAVSLGNSFIFIAISLGVGFSTAITPLTAEADSTANFSRLRSIFKNGLVLCFSIGVFMFIAVYFLKPMIYFMKQPPEVVNLAMPYIDLVAFSLIPLIIFQGLKQFSDGLSMTKYPMHATVIANLANIAFSYLLIFGKLGFPAMGIVGAAYGTLISRLLMLLVLWYLLSQKKHLKKLISKVKILNLNIDMLTRILSLGTPSAMQMFFEVTIFTVAIWLSGLLGKNPQAANQIALNLSSMTFMIAYGLSAVSMIRVGNQKGLRNYKEVRRIAFSIFLMGAMLALFFCILFFIFHKQLPLLYIDLNDVANYSDNNEVLKIASNLLIAAAIFQISDILQVIVLGALRGLQDVLIPTFITLVSYWIIGFPISFYLGKQNMYGSFGIWLGLLAGLTTASVLLYLRFNYLTLKLISTKDI